MSKLVISGYYGSKNAGDEAMLAAMIEVLSDLDPKVNITVISGNPQDTRERHGVDSIGWLDVPGIWSALRSADLLISGGGSLLQNVTSRRSLYYYMGVIFLAILAGTPVMLYAQGIGPIRGTIARWVMSWMGNRVKYITVRDQGSIGELERLHITKPPIEATADPVLAIHPVDRGIGRGILKRYHAEGAKPVVGISVREWCGWKHYKEVLAEAAVAIDRDFDARVVFMPMQYPEDIKTAEIIAEMTKGRTKLPVTVLKDEYTTGELLSIVGNMDLIIAIRLHALIFAGVMGVPMIGVSYDPKIDRFLDYVGEKPVGDLQSITLENLMAEVSRKWNDKKGFKERNGELLNKLRVMAARNAELACELTQKQD